MNYDRFFTTLIQDEHITLGIGENAWQIFVGEYSAFRFVFMEDKVHMEIREHNEKLEGMTAQIFNRSELPDFISTFVTQYEKKFNEKNITKIQVEVLHSYIQDLENFLTNTSLEQYEKLKKDDDEYISIPGKYSFHLISLNDYKQNYMNIQTIDCFFLGDGSMINYRKFYEFNQFGDFLLLREKNLASHGQGFEKTIQHHSTDKEFKAIVSNYFLMNTLDSNQKPRKIGKI